MVANASSCGGAGRAAAHSGRLRERRLQRAGVGAQRSRPKGAKPWQAAACAAEGWHASPSIHSPRAAPPARCTSSPSSACAAGWCPAGSRPWPQWCPLRRPSTGWHLGAASCQARGGRGGGRLWGQGGRQQPCGGRLLKAGSVGMPKANAQEEQRRQPPPPVTRPAQVRCGSGLSLVAGIVHVSLQQVVRCKVEGCSRGVGQGKQACWVRMAQGAAASRQKAERMPACWDLHAPMPLSAYKRPHGPLHSAASHLHRARCRPAWAPGPCIAPARPPSAAPSQSRLPCLRHRSGEEGPWTSGVDATGAVAHLPRPAQRMHLPGPCTPAGRQQLLLRSNPADCSWQSRGKPPATHRGSRGLAGPAAGAWCPAGA